MDNSTDLLLRNSKHAIRPPFVKNDKFVLPPPVVEHGFSALISIPKSERNTDRLQYSTSPLTDGRQIKAKMERGFMNIASIACKCRVTLGHGHDREIAMKIADTVRNRLNLRDLRHIIQISKLTKSVDEVEFVANTLHNIRVR
jgi:hypothetical protein